jgi:fumarate reductase flavoprotein subunit
LIYLLLTFHSPRVNQRRRNMTELSRRSAIKTGLIAAVAAGASAGSVTAGAATKEPKKMVYDVVVVGSGCAGMAAAIEAKQGIQRLHS